VSFSNPFYSALALIGNLGSLAVLYLLLSAEFVAAAQVLVYAGAVMVMFLFVIAYIGPRPTRRGRGAELAASAACSRGRALVEIVVVIGLKARGRRLDRTSTIASAVPPRSAALPDRPPARVRDHVDRAARRRRSAASILGAHAAARREEVTTRDGPEIALVPRRRGVPVRHGRSGVLLRRNR
jgi:hypothetical protein